MDGDQPSLPERASRVRRRKLPAADYHRVGEAGIFANGEGIELVEGELASPVCPTSQHGVALLALNRLPGLADVRSLVIIRGPLCLSECSEARPDILLLKPRDDHYRSDHPTLRDVPLVNEIANPNLRYEREVKLPLHALHRIPEAWIVSLEGNIVEAFRESRGDTYRVTQHAGPGGIVGPAALPGLRLAVTEVLA